MGTDTSKPFSNYRLYNLHNLFHCDNLLLIRFSGKLWTNLKQYNFLKEPYFKTLLLHPHFMVGRVKQPKIIYKD